ncbi:MAG: hypothetical protein HY304_08830 [candidate division Zixibacteria bacterium]|nr:hypothetical protein [candidate division Zixibacteria bacterium]
MIICAGLVLALVVGCSDRGPTKPGTSYKPLAGGGRLQDDDPFTGGPGESGPNRPPIIPDSGLVPIFYSDWDCTHTPSQQLIDNQADWAAWWKAANGCLWRGDSSQMGPGPMGVRDSTWMDSIIIDTVPPCQRCDTVPPAVDFGRDVVLAIRVEYDSGAWCMRAVSITDVVPSAQGATVRYLVSRLDETCCAMIVGPMLIRGTSPVVAVVASRPVNGKITWERTDTTYTCQWGPDPNEPLTLYYTDAACDLGPGETIITDHDRFEAWIQSALGCDSARWHDHWRKPPDSTQVPGDSGWSDPGRPIEPIPMLPWWGGFDVDFSTHAVLILRSGNTTHWGGGIWLNKITRGEAGTVIDYTVMQPGDYCPVVDPDLGTVNPTAAIRVLLPLTPPVTWNRHSEIIDCNWGSDSSWVSPDSMMMDGPR